MPVLSSSNDLRLNSRLCISFLGFLVQHLRQRHQHRLIQRPNHHYLVLEQRLPLRRGNAISTLQVKVLHSLAGSQDGVLSSNNPEAAIHDVFCKLWFRGMNPLGIILVSNNGKDTNWDSQPSERHGLELLQELFFSLVYNSSIDDVHWGKLELVTLNLHTNHVFCFKGSITKGVHGSEDLLYSGVQFV